MPARKGDLPDRLSLEAYGRSNLSQISRRFISAILDKVSGLYMTFLRKYGLTGECHAFSLSANMGGVITRGGELRVMGG